MADLFPGAANFFRTIVNHPCARPWYIYVETFIPAYVELVLLATFPFFDDVIRSRGEYLSGRHAAGGRRGIRHTRRIRASGRETKTQRWSRNGLNTIIKLTAPLESIGFVWLLAAGGDRFFARWQSLIERSDFCSTPIQSGPISRANDGGIIDIGPGGRATNLPILEQDRGHWDNGAFGCAVPSGNFFFTFQATFSNPFNDVPSARARLSVTILGITRHYDGDEVSLSTGEVGSVTVQANFHVPGGFGASVVWQLDGPAIPAGLLCREASAFGMRVG